MAKVGLRHLNRKDWPVVHSIESLSFLHPVTEKVFRGWFDGSPQINVFGIATGIAAERISALGSREVVGYLVYAPEKYRLTVLTMAVHPNHRRQRIGTMLLDDLKRIACNESKRIVIDVRETETAGLEFLRASGIRAVNIVRDIFEEGKDDEAFRFVYRPTESPMESAA